MTWPLGFQKCDGIATPVLVSRSVSFDIVFIPHLLPLVAHLNQHITCMSINDLCTNIAPGPKPGLTTRFFILTNDFTCDVAWMG